MRRPRRDGRCRRVAKAVFLPPNGVPGVSDDDDSGGGETDGDMSTPSQQLSSIDRLLEESGMEYDTWVDRNKKRSLSGIRGREEYMLGAEELNEALKEDHLQRHRHVLAPDEAFGALFMWDVIVKNARELERIAWAAVAKERRFAEPDMEDIVRAEDMAPEAAVSRVFYWTEDWAEVKRCVFEKHEVYNKLQGAFEYESGEGLRKWLAALSRYGVRCILCSDRERSRMEQVVKRLGLEGYFTSNDLVCGEDEFDSLEQMLLVAALKCERPPQKCVVFTDRVRGITAAHEISAKVVALRGVHKAYEVKSADEIVAGWDELVVYNVRRLFSELGAERTDQQTEIERVE